MRVLSVKSYYHQHQEAMIDKQQEVYKARGRKTERGLYAHQEARLNEDDEDALDGKGGAYDGFLDDIAVIAGDAIFYEMQKSEKMLYVSCQKFSSNITVDRSCCCYLFMLFVPTQEITGVCLLADV